MADPTREMLVSLCERAIAGALGLEELHQAWPEPVEDPALVPLRETLEDGVEHTPGYWFKGGVNRKAWERTPEYSDIQFYLRRLRDES